MLWDATGKVDTLHIAEPAEIVLVQMVPATESVKITLPVGWATLLLVGLATVAVKVSVVP